VGSAPAGGDWWQIYRSPALWSMLLVLIAVCTLLAFTLMNLWQPHIQATRAGLIYCSEPVFASLYALFMPAMLARLGRFTYANETATWNLLIGGLIITLANALVQYDR
jgi:drug/metabolite transporter (DMT)-like permease